MSLQTVRRFAVLNLVPMVLWGTLLTYGACVKTSPARYVKSILDVVQVACVLAEEHVEDEHFVAKACDIAEEHIDDVRTLLQGRKMAAQKIAARHADASISEDTSPSKPAASSTPAASASGSK